jgi:hypothetical protein
VDDGHQLPICDQHINLPRASVWRSPLPLAPLGGLGTLLVPNIRKSLKRQAQSPDVQKVPPAGERPGETGLTPSL